MGNLSPISCPVHVIRRDKPGAAISEEDEVRYVDEIPKSKLVVFEESNHNIFEPNLEKFIETVQEFFETVKS